MIRLHLVSLISLLLPYGFRTNLVSTERSIRGEWLQAWYIAGQEAYFDYDSRIPYIPCTILYGNWFFFQNSKRNPPSLSCLRLEDLESLVGSCIGLQSEPQL